MEHIGFYVDRESIQAYGKELEAQVNQLHDEIIQEVGYEFNINSPKQLGEALFGKLGLPHGKKTKSGWSTNADVLEELRLLHPVVDKVLRYRTVAKLKSTYCDGLLKVIGPDGRVHSTFNQTETRRPAPAASPAPSPTCRTSPCAPPSAGSCGSSSPAQRATCWWTRTTPRSSCGCWPTWRTTPP